MHVTGYYIETTNIKDIEMILDEMRMAAKKAGEKQYHKQLSAEIENLVDAITVGTIKRPENLTVYEAAHQLLAEKIRNAGARQADTYYNYNVSANILVLEKRTYFKVNSANDFFMKAFNKIHSLQPFPFGEDWKDLMEKYDRKPLMWIQLLSGNDLEAKREYLKFSSKMDRAERLARHNLTNHLIGQYACGQEIPPHKLMEIMDLAMNELITNKFYKDELAKQKENAMAFLVEITNEVLYGPEEVIQETSEKNEDDGHTSLSETVAE